MSGHSKWSTIKRKRAQTMPKELRYLQKIAREIIVAVKAGGPDPDNNSSLKDAIAKARSNNMPNDNINRTIKRRQAIQTVITTKVSHTKVMDLQVLR